MVGTISPPMPCRVFVESFLNKLPESCKKKKNSQHLFCFVSSSSVFCSFVSCQGPDVRFFSWPHKKDSCSCHSHSFLLLLFFLACPLLLFFLFLELGSDSSMVRAGGLLIQTPRVQNPTREHFLKFELTRSIRDQEQLGAGVEAIGIFLRWLDCLVLALGRIRSLFNYPAVIFFFFSTNGIVVRAGNVKLMGSSSAGSSPGSARVFVLGHGVKIKKNIFSSNPRRLSTL